MCVVCVMCCVNVCIDELMFVCFSRIGRIRFRYRFVLVKEEGGY